MVTRETAVPVARRRCNNPSGIYFADSVVEGICDVKVASLVHGYTDQGVETGAGSRAAIAGEGSDSISCYGGDFTKGIHPPNAMIGSIGNVKVAGSIDRHPEWIG